MKNYWGIFGLLFFINCSKENNLLIIPDSKNVEIVSIKTFGGSKNEVFNAIKKTTDGGFITAGYTQSNNGDITTKTNESFDFWVAKFSSENTLKWQKNYGGSEDDRAADIIQTKDGNFAVLGYTRSADLEVSSNAGFQDFWLIKINANGTLLWEKSFGFSGADYGTTLLETQNGGFLISGVLDVTASNGQGNAKSTEKNHAGGDYWAIKTDNLRNLEWSRFFGGSFTDTPLGIV
ncbi:MAG: hypothetical protein AB8B78_14425, partial [Polaribacter sp.]